MKKRGVQESGKWGLGRVGMPWHARYTHDARDAGDPGSVHWAPDAENSHH